ncbi:MAG: hypothetical protein ABI871_01510 [Chthoniobacterales bacterium]
MIAITFALPAESSAFRARLTSPTNDRHSTAFNGQIHGQRVAILHTGVGDRVAAPRVNAFLEGNDLRCLISAGFAGALDSDLSVGDIVISRNFSHPQLLDLARRSIGGPVHSGQVVNTSRVVEFALDRRQLAERTGAIAVDMETESIARLCAARHLPMLSLRAISDTAVAPFPAPAEILFDIDIQRTPYLLLARHLLRHPDTAGRLIRFSRQIAHARMSLANALSAVLQNLPA